MLRLPSSIVVLAALLPLAGCHARRTGASSADSHAPGTTTASVPADCGKYPPGAPGVIHAYCDGPAVVKLTVAGVAHTLTGGACSTNGGTFALNLGVEAGPDLAGPRPDYVGLSAPVASGHFANALLTVDVDGKAYPITENSGDVAPSGGGFAGKAVSGEAVVATFTC
jgi:hypothetical protein